MPTETTTKFWTDERLAHYQQLRDSGKTINQVCDLMGITDRQARYAGEIIRDSLRKSGVLSADDTSSQAQKLTHHLDQDGYSSEKVMAVKEGHDLDPKQLLSAHGFDPEKFTLTSATSNFWGENSKGEPLYQTKIKVAPVDTTLDDILAAVDKHYETQPDKKHVGLDQKLTDLQLLGNLVVPLFDLHFGISTYDSMRGYLSQIEDRLDECYHNVYIILGGDYYHSDFMSRSMTAKVSGTQLDHVDNVKALADGSRFFEELVDFAVEHTPNVHIYAVGGNHDADKQYMWTYAMKQRYASCDSVDFHLTTDTRLAFRMDDVGVMVAHGDKAKRRLPMLFATEHPQLWGETQYHAIFTGHFHKEVTTDEDGCVLFQVGTPKPSDGYEKDNGFTMARKKLTIFVFDDHKLTDEIYLENDVL